MGAEVHSEKQESPSKSSSSVRRKLRAIVVAIGLTVVGLVVAGIILGSGALIAVVIATGGTLAMLKTPAAIPVSAVIASVVITELGYLGIGGGYIHRWLGGISATVRVPTRREIAWIVGGTIVALTAYAMVAVLFSTAMQNVTTGLSEIVAAHPILAPIIGGLSIILVGPAEELLFRGAIQGRLRRTFGGAVSILLAAILFAAIHVRTGPLLGVLVTLGVIFTVGIVAGTAYERTGNLTVSMLIHGLYNAVVLGVGYLLLG